MKSKLQCWLTGIVYYHPLYTQGLFLDGTEGQRGRSKVKRECKEAKTNLCLLDWDTATWTWDCKQQCVCVCVCSRRGARAGGEASMAVQRVSAGAQRIPATATQITQVSLHGHVTSPGCIERPINKKRKKKNEHICKGASKSLESFHGKLNWGNFGNTQNWKLPMGIHLNWWEFNSKGSFVLVWADIHALWEHNCSVFLHWSGNLSEAWILAQHTNGVGAWGETTQATKKAPSIIPKWNLKLIRIMLKYISPPTIFHFQCIKFLINSHAKLPTLKFPSIL